KQSVSATPTAAPSHGTPRAGCNFRSRSRGRDLFWVQIFSAYGRAAAEAEPPVAATPSSQHVSAAPPPQSPHPSNGGPRDEASRPRLRRPAARTIASFRSRTAGAALPWTRIQSQPLSTPSPRPVLHPPHPP